MADLSQATLRLCEEDQSPTSACWVCNTQKPSVESTGSSDSATTDAMASLATPPPPPNDIAPPAPDSSASTLKAPSTPKPKRPAAPPRQQSASMIVPSNDPEIEAKTPREFPPDDARAMSPRQSNDNLAQMCGESRERIQSSTLEHQSSLAALIEKIETVKNGHEKLERDNNALQEYIGGLTRSMSKTDMAKSGRK